MRYICSAKNAIAAFQRGRDRNTLSLPFYLTTDYMESKEKNTEKYYYELSVLFSTSETVAKTID